MSPADPLSYVDRRVAELFALVSEALAGATDALLGGEAAIGRRIVAADESVDSLTKELGTVVWGELDRPGIGPSELRRLIGVLLILPELERSADLAEHIAQRAVAHLGPSMTPASRGLVQRMSEVALRMWRNAADAYAERGAAGAALDRLDEELDELRDRLASEVAGSSVPPAVAAQVALVARFYERLGDHAVNLARRIESLPPT